MPVVPPPLNLADMAEADLTLLGLVDVFTPRRSPSSPAASRSPGLAELNLMLSMEQAGHLLHSVEPVARCVFRERPRDFFDPYAEGSVHLPATKRRGRADLKDETWSAFQSLKKKHPDGEFTPHWEGLPFGWSHAASGTFVTAGNINPTQMLYFMLDEGMHTLGILNSRGDPPSAVAGGDGAELDDYEMNWLSFDERAIQTLNEHFDQKERARAAVFQRNGPQEQD